MLGAALWFAVDLVAAQSPGDLERAQQVINALVQQRNEAADRAAACAADLAITHAAHAAERKTTPSYRRESAPDPATAEKDPQ